MKILILAGGKSKRMGRDKALIERPDGTRQLDHIIALAQSISGDILVSTNSPEIVPSGIPVLPDLNPGDGPLGALASFHQAYPAEAVLLIGCDLFLLDKATIEQLINAHSPDQSATCFKSRIDARPEPLCAIYESSALTKASSSLASNEYCARHFLEALHPKSLDLPTPAALDNANTPADLEEAFAKITEGVSNKSVKVLYFAKLREERGLDEEQVETLACTAAGLYDELSFRHRLSLKLDSLRCARNGDFCEWNTRLQPNDEIVFIPPVAGG
ncbi:NTP transferase domain-containing protein [Haloferula chungangensis]|uniref:NTP transferase domain-containing protein n=1 Tax=Haloferula chungangensis TaxID=1048331 RepID=A0ABW2L6Q2_9BACT